jgi:hypothetical protein
MTFSLLLLLRWCWIDHAPLLLLLHWCCIDHGCGSEAPPDCVTVTRQRQQPLISCFLRLSLLTIRCRYKTLQLGRVASAAKQLRPSLKAAPPVPTPPSQPKDGSNSKKAARVSDVKVVVGAAPASFKEDAKGPGRGLEIMRDTTGEAGRNGRANMTERHSSFAAAGRGTAATATASTMAQASGLAQVSRGTCYPCKRAAPVCVAGCWCYPTMLPSNVTQQCYPAMQQWLVCVASQPWQHRICLPPPHPVRSALNNLGPMLGPMLIVGPSPMA